jgi:hypothetical protein
MDGKMARHRHWRFAGTVLHSTLGCQKPDVFQVGMRFGFFEAFRANVPDRHMPARRSTVDVLLSFVVLAVVAVLALLSLLSLRSVRPLPSAGAVRACSYDDAPSVESLITGRSEQGNRHETSLVQVSRVGIGRTGCVFR